MSDLYRVAISVDFVQAYSKLGPPQREAVRPVMSALQRDSSLWNYDVATLDGADEMRAIRITPDCWVVVQQSGTGLVLHWVGAPQAAAEWARSHVCAIHPDTGSSQVYRRIDPDMLGGEAPPSGSNGGPLRALSDSQLRRLGVPADQIEFVRQVMHNGEACALEQLNLLIPPEAYESLFDLVLGEPYKKIVARLDVNRSAIGSGGIMDGMDTNESKRQFAVGLSETELGRLLDAPLDTWRVFLHPDQRRPVERDWNGSVRILGGAGTGKTVVALHRSKWLAGSMLDSRDMFAPGRKVLLLTYTRNLAEELEKHLRAICSPQEFRAIEVKNIDRWVWGFLTGSDVSRGNRLFGSNGLGFKTLIGREDDLWRSAMAMRPASSDLSEDFYWEEWRHVIQAQEVMEMEPGLAVSREPSAEAMGRSLTRYLKVKRAGQKRRTALGRPQAMGVSARRAIFPIFETYWKELWRNRRIEWSTAYRTATSELERGRGARGYASVVVDEVQDLGYQALRMIRAMVPKGKNDVMLVGDPHQRLYPGPRVVLDRCGIRVRGKTSIRLTTCYRTPEAIRRWAAGIMDGQPIDGPDDATVSDLEIGRSAVAVGAAPVVRHMAGRQQHDDQVVQLVQSIAAGSQSLEGVCIVARHNSILGRMQGALASAGIGAVILTRRVTGGGNSQVRLATMHRVKGMEFDIVVIADVNDGTVPSSRFLKRCADSESRRQQEMIERSLLYVAATRARRSLYVFSWRKPSPYLPDA